MRLTLAHHRIWGEDSTESQLVKSWRSIVDAKKLKHCQKVPCGCLCYVDSRSLTVLISIVFAFRSTACTRVSTLLPTAILRITPNKKLAKGFVCGRSETTMKNRTIPAAIEPISPGKM